MAQTQTNIRLPKTQASDFERDWKHRRSVRMRSITGALSRTNPVAAAAYEAGIPRRVQIEFESRTELAP